ncbi:MAG: hypothetical protein LC793_07335 [Thermomicrobia bacterium]|nr:hypothetical protein [Thermomicrobia bacterium]
MSGQCKDCQYWERGVGVITICKGWGWCVKSFTTHDKPDNPPTTATAHAEVLHDAWLETAPTHGCTMFEPKE